MALEGNWDEALSRELADAILGELGEAELCRRMRTLDPVAASLDLTRSLRRDMSGTLNELKVKLTTPTRVVPMRRTRRGRKALSFIKWVGSKTSVLSELRPLLPSRFNRYYEPMVGSGTLFFSTAPRRAVLCDLNWELMHCYRVLRDRCTELVQALALHENSEEHFLEVRAQEPGELETVARAARTIYLNKTCFNGLYRVNARGRFNVPFGRIWWANICDEETLARTSLQLRGARLLNGDYARALETAGAGDLVYLDPPYLSSGKGPATFYAYQPHTFGEVEHRRLAKIFRELDQRGCHLMLSNADTELVRELYDGYPYKVLTTRRQVNCKAGQREGWRELIIHNRREETA